MTTDLDRARAALAEADVRADFHDGPFCRGTVDCAPHLRVALAEVDRLAAELAAEHQSCNRFAEAVQTETKTVKADRDALRARVAELEHLRAERDTWRMLGTALADHLCARNDFTHLDVVTVVKAIVSFVQDKSLTSTTPITIEAPHCTHPSAERTIPSTEAEMDRLRTLAPQWERWR